LEKIKVRALAQLLLIFIRNAADANSYTVLMHFNYLSCILSFAIKLQDGFNTR
jgi:hypothetical protein